MTTPCAKATRETIFVSGTRRQVPNGIPPSAFPLCFLIRKNRRLGDAAVAITMGTAVVRLSSIEVSLFYRVGTTRLPGTITPRLKVSVRFFSRLPNAITFSFE